MNKNIIITGSNGFVGNKILQSLVKFNFNIYAFQRKKSIYTSKRITVVKYNLNDEVDDIFFEKSDFLIHCAYTPLLKKNQQDLNLIGSKKLFDKCRQYNVKIIFISTVSAQIEINSRYSKSKIDIEDCLDIKKDCILKLGLVFGNGGLFNNISNFLKLSPIIPVFDNGEQNLQFICIRDVTKVIINLINNFKPNSYVIVKNEGIKMINQSDHK